MKRRTQDFALGLTAIAFVVAIVGTILFLRPLFEGHGRVVTIQFRTEEGMSPLKAGSAVLLGGSLDVGRVLSVGVQEADVTTPAGVEKRPVFVVEAEIRNDIPLYGDCEITTGEPTIGGSGYILISDVGTNGVELKQPIHGQPPQTLSAAIATLSKRLLAKGGLVDQLNRAVDPNAEGSVMYKVVASLDDLNAMTEQMRQELNPQEKQALLAKLHRIVDDVNATTAALRAEFQPGNQSSALAKVNAALDHLDEGLREAVAMLHDDRPLIHDTLVNVEHATRTIDQDVIASLRTEFDPTNPASLIGKLHVAMDRVNASLADVKSMTGTSDRLIAVSQPRLERVLANFQDMSDSLRLASQEVLLNPSKLIWGPKPQREEQLLVFQAARSFADAASQLDDAAGRLQAVLATLPEGSQGDEATRQELSKIYESVQGTFQRFQSAEKALWEQLQ